MFYRFIPILFCAVLLSACGGGSSTDSGEPPIIIDSDGDGVADIDDAFPQDPSESVDTDGDGIGDNADVFPQNSDESVDTDGDGVGDNADVFPQDSGEFADADGDGVGDNADVFPQDSSESVDTDGDGVGDNTDAFSLDASESIDTDGDGIGNNADQDDDDDGISDSDDFYALDHACYKEKSGDGTDCYLTLLKKTLVGEDSTALLYAKRGEKLLVYSSRIKKLLELDGETQEFAVLTGEINITHMTYSAAHNRVYVINEDRNEVAYVENRALTTLITFDEEAIDIASAGTMLAVYTDRKTLLFDIDGKELYSVQTLIKSSPFYYDSYSDSLFYYGQQQFNEAELPPLEPLYDINKIDLQSLTPERQNYAIGERYWLLEGSINSISDRYLLVGNNIINKESLQKLTSKDLAAIDIRLHSGLGLYRLHGSSTSLLSLHDSNLKLVNQQVFEGQPIVLFGDASLFVFSMGEEQFFVHSFEAPDDFDSDGVLNEDDAFPFDQVASKDTDGDGYPDSLNQGVPTSDSVENPLLDAFPLNAYCWDESHQTSDGECEYAPRDTELKLTQVTSNAETVFLLAEGEKPLIYRWSMTKRQYLSPIDLSINGFFNAHPTSIVYLESNQNLYVSYSDGTIIYYEFSVIEPSEPVYLRTFRKPVLNMVTTGDYLHVPQRWIVCYCGGFNSEELYAYTINPNGGEEYISNWLKGVGEQWSWNETTDSLWGSGDESHVYYRYSQNETTGVLTLVNSDGSTVAGEYKPLQDFYESSKTSILASPSGQQLLIGNGGIYNIEDDTWRQTPNDVDYAVWTSDERLVTLEQGEQEFFLHRHDQEYGVVESSEFEGDALGLIVYDDEIMVLSNNGQGFVIDVYEPQP